MDETLYRPDAYVFIDIPPEVSKERAKQIQRVADGNNMWLLYPERIDHWYN